MGTSAQERIALHIESSADLGAVHEARAAEENLRNETSKLTATVDQSREAWARAGGDMNKFAVELAKLVQGEAVVATAVKTTTLAEAQAIETTKNLTAATREVNTQLAAQGQQAVVAAEKTQAISPKARTATNSLAILAQSAVMGTGSLAGLAVAGGNLAQGLAAASRSASLAASATGIGALVTSLGILIPLMVDANEEAEKWTRNFGGYSLKGLEIAAQRNREQANEIQQQLQAFESLPIGIRTQVNAGSVISTGKGYGEALLERLKQNSTEQQKIDEALADARRTKSKEEQKAAEDRAKRDLERATSLEQALNRAYYEARDERTLSEEDASVSKIRRAANEQRLEIEQLAIVELEKKTLREAITRAEVEQVGAIRDAAAKERKTKEDKDAKEAEDRTRKMIGVAVGGLATIVQTSSSLKQVLIRATLEPIERFLLGVAVKQGVIAAEHFAALDLFGGGRHAAVAALAAAAAGKVAQLAGGSGGGGSAVGGGGGGGGTFSPRSDASDRNPTVINLITQDPYSGEKMSVVQYELTRGGVLKRPVNIPPTTGLAAVH